MSALSPPQFRRFLAVVFATAVAIGPTIAAMGVPEAQHAAVSDRLMVAVGISSGPLSGWVQVIRTDTVRSAWPLLSVATVVSLALLCVATLLRSDVALAVSAMLWLSAGYLFTIAIWV